MNEWRNEEKKEEEEEEEEEEEGRERRRGVTLDRTSCVCVYPRSSPRVPSSEPT